MSKSIKSGLISSAIILLTVALVFYIFPIANTGWFSFHVHAQGAGGPIELACPNGTVPLSNSGTTFNQLTQKYRQWLCVDPSGHVTNQADVNTNVNGFPLLAPNGSASAPSYSFANQTGTGMFYNGVGISWSVNGTADLVMATNTSSLTSSFAITAPRYIASGGAPTCTVSAGAGTGATCSMSGNSTDNSGQMQINTGTTPGSSGTITLTYNSSFPNVACPIGMLVNASSSWNARATIIGTSTCSNNTYVFNWDNNAISLTASQADSLAVNYAVIGK